jgi:hypothetical protein
MKREVIFMLISFLGISIQSEAQGDLLVTPKRVIFEGNKQKEELSLVNIGKDTATYSISFVQRSMKEDGSFINIDKSDPDNMFADPFLRVFPRTVTLAPGEPQVIALQCRRKPDMKEGEYRSHLYFRAEKNNKPLGSGDKGKDTTLLSVQLIPVFGLSIPIIIRSGDVNVSAALSDLKIETRQDSIQVLKLTLNRSGNISIYGNIIAEYMPLKGKSYEIGSIKGVGVYTDINRRNISMKLGKTQGMAIKNGKLRVRYTSPDESKYVVYAESEIDIIK